jgi:hypothetical protein
MATYDEIVYHVIYYLFNQHYIGKRHTNIENVARGVPKHDQGSCISVARDLLKQRLLIPKKTKHGFNISLNPRMIKEIRKILNIK